MSNNLMFIPYQDSNSEARSRRIRSRRACSECRYKKRRCSHTLRKSPAGHSHSSRGLRCMESQTTSNYIDTNVAGLEAETERASHQEQHKLLGRQSIQAQQQQNRYDGIQHQQPQQQQDQTLENELEEDQTQQSSDAYTGPPTPRFAGDLAPETRLLDNAATFDYTQEIYPGDEGVWAQPQLCRKCGSSSGRCSPSVPCPPSRSLEWSHPLVTELLSHETIKVLSDLYFAKVNPIIPLLNEEEYRQSLSRGTTPIPLVHVVCLLAAKDDGAEKHLKLLQSTDTLLSVREFCSRLYLSLCTTLSRRTAIKKLTLVRILGLLSLHQEGKDGAEQASSCIARAMHYAQSLALHLPQPTDVDGDLKRTFWCLWTLDRLNSATNSRPCIMSDIDIAIPDLTPEESGSVAFDVWFRITKILNEVIGLYRPKAVDAVSGWDSTFPGFEQIMDEMQAWQLSPPIIDTLYIFFLATAMLAHRLKNITTAPSPTPARLRQRLSAIQVIRYMEDTDRANALHPFPIVVYAVSLAISVSYQQLRYSRLSSEREDARQDFYTGCDILQELRRKWGSADRVATLAHRNSATLDQLPRLNMLQGSRCDQIKRVSSFAGNRGVEVTTQGLHAQQSVDLPLDCQAPNLQTIPPGLEIMDLSPGIDDVSWMRVDAENLVGFDSPHLMNFDDPYDIL